MLYFMYSMYTQVSKNHTWYTLILRAHDHTGTHEYMIIGITYLKNTFDPIYLMCTETHEYTWNCTAK